MHAGLCSAPRDEVMNVSTAMWILKVVLMSVVLHLLPDHMKFRMFITFNTDVVSKMS